MTPSKGPDGLELIDRELTGEIIGGFYECYNELGFGFLESVYARALAMELRRRTLVVATEVAIEVRYKGASAGHFRLDMLVESRIAIELKAATQLGPTDKRQLLNYLRATDLDIGLLLHFGPEPAFHRLASPRVIGARRERIRLLRRSSE